MTKTPQYILHNQGNKGSRKGTHQQAQKVGNSTKEKKGVVCTSSNSRHFIKPLSHGLFPLEVLLVSIKKGLLRFLYLSQCRFSSLLSSGFSGSGGIPSFSRSFEFSFQRRNASISCRQSICSSTKRKEKSSKEARKGIQDKQSIGKKITLGGPSSFQILDTFIAQGDKLLHQVLSRKKYVSMKITQETKANMPVSTRTLSEELVDRWASRKAPASVDFFARLEPRVATIFLTGALGAFGDFTTGSTSCEGGSSIAGVSVAGVAAANLFGFSSSLKRKQKVEPFIQVDRKKRVYENKQQNTHESMRSKSSTSSSGAEVSPITVVCAEVLEERSSIAHFLFLSTPRSSESAGGGDIVELVSSSESSHSSASWLSLTLGASEAAETGTF
jgi:hypothetical protein